jgi:23S rRNA (uracil1939-C5)-methyltransferase
MTGLDSEGDQILTARLNAEVNHLAARASFKAVDLYQAEGVASLDFSGVDFALLDPPRTGALELCRSLTDHAPSRLLYISCGPSTLARDAEVLVKEKGYRLDALGLVDMFPQTVQAESMALFEHTRVRPSNGSKG